MLKFSDLFWVGKNRRSIVMMYHKIAKPLSDVWDISVTPENFEQHLKQLKLLGNVVPLESLVNSIYNGKLAKNKIALTFDDGYADNFHIAAPLLQKYNLPATFFITGSEGKMIKEFWWDSLERIILFSNVLPLRFSMLLQQEQIVHNIGEEATLTSEIKDKHCKWCASDQTPPTKRAVLYYHLWKKMKHLPFTEQCLFLQRIKEWANADHCEVESNNILTFDDLKEFSKSDLFGFGVHTATHAALGLLDTHAQQRELVDNIQYLKKILGREISLVSYPYGSYNGETLKLSYKLGLRGGFTTEQHPVESVTSPFKIGRFQIKNVNGSEFKKSLNTWSLVNYH